MNDDNSLDEDIKSGIEQSIRRYASAFPLVTSADTADRLHEFFKQYCEKEMTNVNTNGNEESSLTSTTSQHPNSELSEEEIAEVLGNINLGEGLSAQTRNNNSNPSNSPAPGEISIQHIAPPEASVEFATPDVELIFHQEENDNDDIPTPQNPVGRNSETVTDIGDTTRFSGAKWFSQVRHIGITLAGLGGIGSNTALCIARLHPCVIALYDGDIINGVNMAGQLFEKSFIGCYKSDAIVDMMKRYANYYNAISYNRMFNSTDSCSNISICGFDSMESRRIFYSSWKNRVARCIERHTNNTNEPSANQFLFIDARMAAEEFQVFAFTGEDKELMKIYENKYCFTDDEAEPTFCSYKQTAFVANIIGGVITNIVVNFAYNLCSDIPIKRPVPFLTEYDASKMFLKVTE
jgi:hypothetical protein